MNNNKRGKHVVESLFLILEGSMGRYQYGYSNAIE